jgi:hypothetical protein
LGDNFAEDNKPLVRTIFLGIVIAIFLVAFWSDSESDLHISARSDIGKILSSKQFNEELLPIWSGALGQIQDGFDLRKIRVNQPYEYGSINVYFFDTRNTGDLSVAGKSVLGNFITIQPDIVFADEEFVKLFVDEYHFYRGSLLQIWERNKQFSASDIRRTLIGSTMLRYANIDNFYEDPYGDDDPLYSSAMVADFERYASYESINQFFEREIEFIIADPLLSGFVGFLEIARKQENGSDLPNDLEDIISGLVAQAISFPFLHELGHLDSRTDGGFFNAKVGQPAKIEQDADAYAIAALAGVPNSDWAIGAEFSAALLQQIVFARTLQVDFMDAQKLGNFIVYNESNCASSIRGFFDFNLILDILPTTLPLLTEDEYYLFQSKLEEFSSRSHGFLLDRGVEIEALAVSSDLSVADDIYASYKAQRRDFLGEVFSNNLEGLESTQRRYFDEIFGEPLGLAGMKFEFSDFMREQEQVSAWCPFKECSVISDDILSVRFEEMRDESGIVFARLMLRDLFPRDSDAAKTLASRPDIEAISNNRFSVLLSFLDEATTIPYDDLLSRMRELYSCGFTSFERDEGTHFVRFSTIGNWYEIQVELIAKP